jgi:hypothetical protein
MKNNTPLIIAALLISLFTGCSKHSQSANSIPVNLGVVEVSDGVPSIHDIGDGKVCIVVPTIQKDGSVKIDITVAPKSGSAGKSYAMLGLETLPDQAIKVSNNVMAVNLTPHIKK